MAVPQLITEDGRVTLQWVDCKQSEKLFPTTTQYDDNFEETFLSYKHLNCANVVFVGERRNCLEVDWTRDGEIIFTIGGGPEDLIVQAQLMREDEAGYLDCIFLIDNAALDSQDKPPSDFISKEAQYKI